MATEMLRRESATDRREDSRRPSDERRGDPGYLAGRDAAYIKPRLMPDAELLGRDDSGGLEWDPYTQQWGDGGYITGKKPHLMARGGGQEDETEGDEVSSRPRRRAAREGVVSPAAPGKSKAEAKEE